MSACRRWSVGGLLGRAAAPRLTGAPTSRAPTSSAPAGALTSAPTDRRPDQQRPDQQNPDQRPDQQGPDQQRPDQQSPDRRPQRPDQPAEGGRPLQQLLGRLVRVTQLSIPTSMALRQRYKCRVVIYNAGGRGIWPNYSVCHTRTLLTVTSYPQRKAL